MNPTQQEKLDWLVDSLKSERRGLFQKGHFPFFVGLSILCGALASYSIINGTTAILIVMVYLFGGINTCLEGIFKQLEWLRIENAKLQFENDERLGRLAEIIIESRDHA